MSMTDLDIFQNFHLKYIYEYFNTFSWLPVIMEVIIPKWVEYALIFKSWRNRGFPAEGKTFLWFQYI